MSEQRKEKQWVLNVSSLWKASTVLLLLVIAGLLVYTQPWDRVSENPRNITITGEVSLKRAPDSFVFNPIYEADTQEMINEKSKEVVAAVKALGLGDAGIQTTISNYSDYGYDGAPEKMKYQLYATFSVEDLELAQKIQNYLAESGATGQISPDVGFTNNTKKELRDEATIKAIEDARERAERTAQSLGVRLGKVIKIHEPDDYYYDVYPIASYDATLSSEGDMLPINAGESEFPFKIKVEFEIR